MYEIEVTRKYLKDLELARKRKLDESKLVEVIDLLHRGEKLPPKNKDHSLSGKYRGYRECHIAPDWLLVYSRNDALRVVCLTRTGTHSDLF